MVDICYNQWISLYLPVTTKKVTKQKKPSKVPFLDLELVPKYQDSSSSDEEGEGDTEGQKNRKGPNPKQVKQILDKYNIMTCARNMIEQEKRVKEKRQEARARLALE